MASKYGFVTDDEVLCPYYKLENQIKLKCYGICGANTIHTFASIKEKQDFKDDFCCGYYWNCPLYIALDMDDK